MNLTMVPPNVQLVYSRWLPQLGGWLTGRRRPMTAVTIGHTIYLHPGRTLSQRLLRHELVHVAQWERYGWTFPIRYAWAHVRDGYLHNRFEVEARKAER
jgi:hypothetical protein